MEFIDNRAGGRMSGCGTTIRKVQLMASQSILSLFGPGQHQRLHYIDVRFADKFKNRYEHHMVNDAYLVKAFDEGLDAAAWLDLLAERHPEYQWVVDLFIELCQESR